MGYSSSLVVQDFVHQQYVPYTTRGPFFIAQLGNLPGCHRSDERRHLDHHGPTSRGWLTPSLRPGRPFQKGKDDWYLFCWWTNFRIITIIDVDYVGETLFPNEFQFIWNVRSWFVIRGVVGRKNRHGEVSELVYHWHWLIRGRKKADVFWG